MKTSYQFHYQQKHEKEHTPRLIDHTPRLIDHFNMSATTNLGPLTTTFSPPSDCLSQTFRYTRSDLLCGNTHCGWLHLGNASDTRCVPSGYQALSNTDLFYAPGVCPKSYTAACSNVITSGTEVQTIATCCPKCELDSLSSLPRSMLLY